MIFKRNILATFAIFALVVLSISAVSALSLSSQSNFLTESQNSASVSLTNNDGSSQDVNLSITDIVDGANQVSLSVSPSSVTGLADSGTESVTINVTSIIGDLNFGKYSATLSATGSLGNNATETVTFYKTFCSAGEVGGKLKIKDIKIDNTGSGKDDEWNLLDTIEIEVEVENVDSDDVDDVFVELALYDSSGDNFIRDLEFENDDEEEFDIGRIRDDEEETATFSLRVPADFEDGNYKLVVKAYSDDLGESDECTDTSNDLGIDNLYEEISVERESDEGKFISFQDIVLNPTDLTCGDSATLRTNVYNIGDEDQERVKVNLFNSELGLSMSKEITSDLDQGDDTQVSFTFVIPEDAENKFYLLNLNADYDYRDSSGTYRESSDDTTTHGFTLVGCNVAPETPENTASISATLSSSAVAGQPLVIVATITNLASETKAFVIDAEGYQSWASLDSVSQRVLSLNAGQSSDVTLTFIPNKDVSGQQSFKIKAQSGADIQTRDVVVNIEPKGGFLTGSVIGSGNTLIWTIGIINVVLIILIIIVAVSLARR